MVCLHDVMGKKNFWFQFEYGTRKEMITYSLMLVCYKEDVDQGR